MERGLVGRLFRGGPIKEQPYPYIDDDQIGTPKCHPLPRATATDRDLHLPTTIAIALDIYISSRLHCIRGNLFIL